MTGLKCYHEAQQRRCELSGGDCYSLGPDGGCTVAPKGRLSVRPEITLRQELSGQATAEYNTAAACPSCVGPSHNSCKHTGCSGWREKHLGERRLQRWAPGYVWGGVFMQVNL